MFREVGNLRRYVPVTISVHHPSTPDGAQALSRRAAEIQSEAVIRRLKDLDAPVRAKEQLLQSFLAAVRTS